MRHHGFPRPHGGPARAGLTALRATAAAAMLFGSLTVGIGAAGAQADEDEGTYESPTYGYTLEWDAEGWTVEQDAAQGDISDATDAEFSRDFLQLNDVDSTTVLFVEGAEDEFRDVDECVETVVPELGIDPADGEAIEDEDGEAFELSDDTRARAGYILPVELDNGDTEDRVYGVECVADEDSDVIVAFSFISGIVDGYVENGYPLVEDIVGSLAFAGGSGGTTPEASDDAEPSDRAEGSDDSDPSDDADPSDDSGSGGDATEGGVSDNTYLSPTWFYVMGWDEEVWTVEDAVSEDEIDTLSLSSDILILNVTGSAENGDDPQDCVDPYVEVLSDRGDGDAAILETDDGPAVQVADDGSFVQAIIAHSDGGTQYATILYCFATSTGAVVSLEFTGQPDDLVSDAGGEQMDDILGRLIII